MNICMFPQEMGNTMTSHVKSGERKQNFYKRGGFVSLSKGWYDFKNCELQNFSEK